MAAHRSAHRRPRQILPPAPAPSSAAPDLPVSQEVTPVRPPNLNPRLSPVRRLSRQTNQAPSALEAPVDRRLMLHLLLAPRDHLEH